MTSTPVNRRRFLRTAAAATVGTAGVAAAGLAPALAETSAPGPAAKPRREAGTAQFRWLGTSGWRIDVAGQTVLIDPYLSRYPVGLAAGKFNPATPLTVDEAAVEEHTGGADHVFVTHTHWDHFNDVPHVASTGARVYGTLTTYHVGLSYGVPSSQLSVVKGGEMLDFGGYRVEVIASLHSRNGGDGMTFPRGRGATPDRPAPIAHPPQGDTPAV